MAMSGAPMVVVRKTGLREVKAARAALEKGGIAAEIHDPSGCGGGGS